MMLNKTKALSIPLSGLVAALAWPYAAVAQATGNSAPAMAPVVVTTVAPSEPLIFITNPKLPRQPLPASDGTDYLKTIPGFSAIRGGGTNGDPVLRGMFGSRLNILTDGSAMPGACGGRMDPTTSYISPENYDRLTVIKGPQSVLWGPGASAGTVKFDRDTPRFVAAGIRFEGSLVGGSFGRNDQTADLTVGNDKVYTRFTANHSHSQDYKDGDGNTVPSRWDKWNADLTLGFTPDADTLYELTAGTGDGESRYASRGMDGTQFKRESFGVRFEKRNLGAALNMVQAQLYYNDANHVMDNYTLRSPNPFGPMSMAKGSNVDRTTWGGRLATTWTLADDLSLVSGVDFQRSRQQSRFGTGKNAYRNQSWTKKADMANTGLFGELTWSPLEGQRVIGGARLDWAQAKDYRFASSATPPDNRRQDTLPSGFLRYERDLDALPATWYVGLGHVERFPDYWELFSPSKGPAGSVNAFNGVKPEKTTQLDVGAHYKTDALDAWVSGYAGVIHDFILFNYGGGGAMRAGKQVTNVDARIFGGEMGASHKLTPRWTTGATLAYAWGRNNSDGRPLPQFPPLEARLLASYDNGAWSAGALWRIVAAQNRYALNQGNVVGKDFGPSAGFGVVSVNGGYAFSKQAKLMVGVDNLFNKTYSEHLNLAAAPGFGLPAGTSLNEPGRTVWARISVKY